MGTEPPGPLWSVRARDQLRAIADYYVEHATADAALRVLGGIRTKAEEVARFPTSGSLVEGLDGTYRRARAGSYHLLYRIGQDGRTVRILALRHVRQRPLPGGAIQALDRTDVL
jgi:plasmid stabilization system protein ParE